MAGCGSQGIKKTGVFAGKEENVTMTLTFFEDGSYEFSSSEAIFDKEQTLRIDYPEGTTVYYSLDGSVPTNHSTKYSGPIGLGLKQGAIPDAYAFRFACIREDGSTSQVASKTFFVEKDAGTRFTVPVVSIIMPPSDYGTGKGGMMSEEMIYEKGRDSEYACHIEAYDADGTMLFCQNGGIRVAGNHSRTFPIKSFSIYARKSYDEEHKNFKTDIFRSEKLNGEDGYVDSYDKLRLRCGGNDSQFTFIKDELSQDLARQAGFDFYENCIPAGLYINGEYYCYTNIHESYTDKYFSGKLGKHEGEFITMDGRDATMMDVLPEENMDEYVAKNDFDQKMAYFLALDYKKDSSYDELNRYFDVQNYLDYFAFNIVIGNGDWPNNNVMYFRYEPGENGSYGTGYYDGRWRFLVHDAEYTYNYVGSLGTTAARYNDLADLLNPEHDRYAPLFSALWENEKARTYFLDKARELNDLLMTEENLVNTYSRLHAARETELNYFFKYVRKTLRYKNPNIWCSGSTYSRYERDMLEFFAERHDAVEKFLTDRDGRF